MKRVFDTILRFTCISGLLIMIPSLSCAESAAWPEDYMHNQTPDVVDSILEKNGDQQASQKNTQKISSGQSNGQLKEMVNCIERCVKRKGYSVEVCIVDCEMSMLEKESEF